MSSKAAVKRIIETLKGIYPDALCSLQYEKDYELLFAVRLSAQCTDERVNKVTPALFERFPTLESFAEADPKEVGEYIHSCGFYNGKARDLVACAQQLLEKHGGRVPGTMEELTALPGVGRKTANLILGDIFGQEGYVCDTHCIRITGRLGITDGSKEAYSTPIFEHVMATQGANGNATMDADLTIIDGKLYAAFACTNLGLYLYEFGK